MSVRRDPVLLRRLAALTAIVLLKVAIAVVHLPAAIRVALLLTAVIPVADAVLPAVIPVAVAAAIPAVHLAAVSPVAAIVVAASPADRRVVAAAVDPPVAVEDRLPFIS